MGRKLGSKNKSKEPDQPTKVVAAEVITTNPPKWTPTPDMGDIKPPVVEMLDCSNCSHKGSHHYGGISNWCNVTRCNCQAFK